MHNRNILIYNTIGVPEPRDRFDEVIVARIFPGEIVTLLHLDEPIPALDDFTHLLLTGSELSAAAGSQWDADIMAVIRHFLDAGKSILGICHGHQMLARVIGGDSVVRRAHEPEFGWKQMQITANPLFAGISDPVFLESRYDEVYQLPAGCIAIARNSTEAIQAFQLSGRAVWGVQFHPEMLYDDGTEMVEQHLREHPEERCYWADESRSAEAIENNLQLFNNFLKADFH
jgi:GMP synthase (glutamine-hydrolysing)